MRKAGLILSAINLYFKQNIIGPCRIIDFIWEFMLIPYEGTRLQFIRKVDR